MDRQGANGPLKAYFKRLSVKIRADIHRSWPCGGLAAGSPVERGVRICAWLTASVFWFWVLAAATRAPSSAPDRTTIRRLPIDPA